MSFILAGAFIRSINNRADIEAVHDALEQAAGNADNIYDSFNRATNAADIYAINTALIHACEDAAALSRQASDIIPDRNVAAEYENAAVEYERMVSDYRNAAVEYQNASNANIAVDNAINYLSRATNSADFIVANAILMTAYNNAASKCMRVASVVSIPPVVDYYRRAAASFKQLADDYAIVAETNTATDSAIEEMLNTSPELAAEYENMPPDPEIDAIIINSLNDATAAVNNASAYLEGAVNADDASAARAGLIAACQNAANEAKRAAITISDRTAAPEYERIAAHYEDTIADIKKIENHATNG